MRPVLIVLSALLLTACASSHVRVSAASGSPAGAPAAGTSVTAGSTGLHVRGSGGLATAIVVMSLIAAGIEYNREDRPFPDPRALVPGGSERPGPLAPERRTHEQDCSQPIADPYANLKCK
jgi:hypothetical protein